MERYDRLCDQLRFNMCKEMVVKWDSEQWYDHVCTEIGGNWSWMWGYHIMAPTVQTDRTVPNNKPDIVMSDNEKEYAC
jgi:hypothetical protein